ncbi:MAG: hemerythrin domain-containing protein [Caulobacterales bacterium]
MSGADLARRGLLIAAAGGSALALADCAKGGKPAEADVSAVEDLMREHGVLRRVLVVYREAAGLVRANFSSVNGRLIWRAADLFRRFGESYHEQKLEEAHIFPQAMKAGGEAARLVPILIGQHARGSEITAYIQAKTGAGGIATSDADGLVQALEGFARMYEAHSAYEDTIVFQAWRGTLGKSEQADAAAQFDAIEHETFKGEGFEPAVAEIDAIEKALRIHDLSRYTAGPPGVAPPPVIAMPDAVTEGAD